MGTKKHRMTVGLDSEDIHFLQETGVFRSTNDGIRFAVKFLRIYGMTAVKNINGN